jgi:four helix bundle protein
MTRRNHKDLVLWRKAVALAQAIHASTVDFPKHELFGLTQQLRRAAVSIPSNIAEGAARSTTRDFLRFLYMARGSFAELETQLHLAEGFGYMALSEEIQNQLDEVGRLLNALIKGLRRRLSPSDLPPAP